MHRTHELVKHKGMEEWKKENRHTNHIKILKTNIFLVDVFVNNKKKESPCYLEDSSGEQKKAKLGCFYRRKNKA